jgi:hypothetical protein
MSEETVQPKTRKPRKKKEAAPQAPRSDFHVGVRKTRLMELAEYYGDTGLMNPRSIDPLVYMLAEMGEAAFGKSVIDACWDEVALTNAGFSKQKSLAFLADQMVRKYLADAFFHAGKDDMGQKLSKMPAFSETSYVDYFMSVSMLDRDTFRTDLHKVSGNMIKIVTGYQTEQAGQVCDAIVSFFKATKNKTGFEELLKGLGRLVKNKKG